MRLKAILVVKRLAPIGAYKYTTSAREANLRLRELRPLAGRFRLCDPPQTIVHDIVGGRGLVVGKVLDELLGVGNLEEEELLKVLNNTRERRVALRVRFCSP